MKPVQQDDICDESNKKQKQKYYYNKKVIRAYNKIDAVLKFKSHYNIIVQEDKLTNDISKMIIIDFSNEDVGEFFIINGNKWKLMGWEDTNDELICFFNGFYNQSFNRNQIEKLNITKC